MQDRGGQSMIRVWVAAALLAMTLLLSACSAPTSTPAPPAPAGLPSATSSTSNSPGPAGQQISPAEATTPAHGSSGALSATAALGSTPVKVPSATPIVVPTPEPSATVAATPLPTPTVAPTAFSGQRAWEDVRYLAEEIGSRPSGSDALLQAAEYIRGQFARMGYEAALQGYSYTQSQGNDSELLLKRPIEAQVTSSALFNSGSGSVEDEIVFAGLGRPSDFPSGGLHGAIALIERGTITFQEKVENASAKGASAVVIFNDRPGVLHGALRDQAGVPVVAITQQDGQQLREYMRQGPVEVSLTVASSPGVSEGNNVVASGPVDPGRDTVVIGAHYDSVDAGPGANDNGSGTGTLLEIARAVRGRDYPFNLVFVAFGDEEIGLVGSRHYVEALTPEERGRIAAMINLDMVGVGTTMEFGGTGDLTSLSIQIAHDLGYKCGPS